MAALQHEHLLHKIKRVRPRLWKNEAASEFPFKERQMCCGCQLRAQPGFVYSGQFVHSKQTQAMFLSIFNDLSLSHTHSYILSHTHTHTLQGAVVKYLWPGEAAVLLYLIELQALSIALALVRSQPCSQRQNATNKESDRFFLLQSRSSDLMSGWFL